MSGAVDSLQGRDAHKKDLAWRVGPYEPHEVQQDKVQGPAMRPGQSLISMQAGGWLDWVHLCEEEFVDTDECKTGYEPAKYSFSPESQAYPEISWEVQPADQSRSTNTTLFFVCLFSMKKMLLHWCTAHLGQKFSFNAWIWCRMRYVFLLESRTGRSGLAVMYENENWRERVKSLRERICAKRRKSKF